MLTPLLLLAWNTSPDALGTGETGTPVTMTSDSVSSTVPEYVSLSPIVITYL